MSQIATKMGRLAYLARLKNPETDKYEHHGLAAVFGDEAAEDALRRSHIEVLEEMLNMSILDQKDDVDRYLEGLPQSARRLLANWDKSKGYEAILPSATSAAQKELFDGNLGLIIKHLKVEFADGEQHPDS
ncbi:MAG: hypothetical protein NTW74_11485 [Acidobacteria bacterium]|nr:hypothetical protein [Acidobacteriota bacterium]